jgi:O-antigen ligase
VERLSTLTPEGIREDSSALGRFQMFPDAFRAFASNPITGVGLVGYIPWAVEHGTNPHGIHSAFLQVFAEHGLLGFVPFVAIVVLTWSQFTRAWRLARRGGARRDPELRGLEIRALLLQIGFAGAIVMSLAQPSTHHKSLWLLFALSTPVLELVRKRARALVPAEAQPPPGWEPGFGAPAPLGPRLDAGAP